MAPFQRMKEELDELGHVVTNKLPVIGKGACIIISFVCLGTVLLIGLGIGYAVSSSSSTPGGERTMKSISEPFNSGPHYLFIRNNTKSCPPLQAERLLTTMNEGDSFEGLVVSLTCRGEYNPFPNQVKCVRKSPYDEELRWSHVPVCYPTVLVSKKYWSQTLHARSASCTGDASQTRCKLNCIHDYIAVEKHPYNCQSSPCKAWTLGDARCYMCHEKCREMHDAADPSSSTLLSALGCTPECNDILVNSDGNASIWQNRRTGWFTFIGEYNSRPVYQNNATKEFLFYTFIGSEWLVGPDFRKSHAGIQLYGNENKFCPEKSGGDGVSKLYIDSSAPSVGGTGSWTEDPTLSIRCMTPEDFSPSPCSCKRYKVYNLVYANGTVPKAVEYLSGNFSLEKNHLALGLLSPVYVDRAKDLFLFSHHPKGRVWQISSKFSSTPMRGLYSGDGTGCPDDDSIRWEWYNTTNALGQQFYVHDRNIKVKCVSK